MSIDRPDTRLCIMFAGLALVLLVRLQGPPAVPIAADVTPAELADHGADRCGGMATNTDQRGSFILCESPTFSPLDPGLV